MTMMLWALSVLTVLIVVAIFIFVFSPIQRSLLVESIKVGFVILWSLFILGLLVYGVHEMLIFTKI